MYMYNTQEIPWTNLQSIGIQFHIEEMGDWFYDALFKIQCIVDFFLEDRYFC